MLISFKNTITETPRIMFGLPWLFSGKASACNVENVGLIPGSEDPLEKEMAMLSSILAWETPWAEEPGSLQSMGSQRVGHD